MTIAITPGRAGQITTLATIALVVLAVMCWLGAAWLARTIESGVMDEQIDRITTDDDATKTTGRICRGRRPVVWKQRRDRGPDAESI